MARRRGQRPRRFERFDDAFSPHRAAADRRSLALLTYLQKKPADDLDIMSSSRSGLLRQTPFFSRRMPAFWPALVGGPLVVVGNIVWILGPTITGLVLVLAGFAASAAGLVRLRYGERQLTLRIADDGIGFPTSGVNGAGRGLKNMRERAQLLEGALVVEGTPSEGVTVVLTIPTGDRSSRDRRFAASEEQVL